MRNELVPVLCVALGASLWGITGLFTRGLYADGVTPIQMTMVRGAITAAVILLVILLRDRKALRIEPRDIWMFVGTGLFSIVFFTICYFTAQQMVSLSTACVLLYTAPCFVVVMSAILFKEKVTKYKALALICAFVGCACASGIGLGDFNLGIAYGVLAGFGYALYSIFGKYALAKYSQTTVLFYTFLICAVCLLPFSDVPQIIGLCGDGDIVIGFLGLGVVVTLLPYLFYTTGLKYMDAGKASIIAFAEPMVATVVSILVGDEFGAMNVIGIVMILGSIILLSLKTENSEKDVSG